MFLSIYHNKIFQLKKKLLHQTLPYFVNTPQPCPKTLRQIKDDALVGNLDKFSIDQECVDVAIIFATYNSVLSDLLDKLK